MPIHHWKRVEAGLFHHFHQQWIAELSVALNAGALPRGYYGMIERSSAERTPDILTFESLPPAKSAGHGNGGLVLADAPPQTRYVMQADMACYVARANRLSIRHPLGDVVAVLEVVSPGNKSSTSALGAFVTKSLDLLHHGIHLLVIDLLPPTKRDPNGIHGAIWAELNDESFVLPPDKPLTLASYAAADVKTAYVEPVAVGDALPSMPLFLAPRMHVPVPLEETYMRTWAVCPQPMREAVEAAG